jgi:NADH-quinone oxidoreductase subunit C
VAQGEPPAAEEPTPAEGEGAETIPPTEQQPKVETPPERAAKPERPAKAEAKVPEREPAPAGSIADAFKEALPDVTFEAYQGFSNVIVEINRDDVAKVARAAKDDSRLDLKFLRCLSGIDHMDDGLEVAYQLMSLEKGHEVTIKARIPQDDPRVASVASVWKAADWHEREARDMFGIVFEGHPHLVPLLLPEDMLDHHPLRKDSPLAEVEEWQGDILGDDVGQAGHIPAGSREAAGGSADSGGEE